MTKRHYGRWSAIRAPQLRRGARGSFPLRATVHGLPPRCVCQVLKSQIPVW